MQVALYARVSKKLEQNPENQLIALREWAKINNYEVVGEYVDEISSKDTRPQKEEVLRLLRLGYIQGVGFYAIDRWGRNMVELVMEMQEFANSGKMLISLKDGFDLGTAAGRLGSHILCSMAAFERERIIERTHLGLARAKAQGKQLGRHKKNCKCKVCTSNRAKATPPEK